MSTEKGVQELATLVLARAGLAESRQALQVAEDRLQSAVKAALAAGVAATAIADELGLSRARVYQLRDGVR